MQRVEPVEEGAATIRLELEHGKLVLFLFQTLEKFSTWSVGGFPAFDAVRVKTRVPALGGVAVRAAWMFLVAIEKWTYGFS